MCLEKSFDEYTKEFKENNTNILAQMFERKNLNMDERVENGDEYSFLDSSRENDYEQNKKENVEQKMETAIIDYTNEDIFSEEATLTEEQIENWTVFELENYLLTFIPTEVESLWLKK